MNFNKQCVVVFKQRNKENISKCTHNLFIRTATFSFGKKWLFQTYQTQLPLKIEQ